MGQLNTEHPELLKEWNYEKNGDLRPEDLTSGSGKKVWWVCSKGHEWQTAVYNRTKGTKCPVCSGNQVLTGFNDLATTNPELAAQWHPTKNGNLKPEEVMSGSSKKVWWICSKGHEWQTTISNRGKSRRGCPYCAGQRAQKGIDDLATLRPDIAAQWHPSKNGNLTPSDVKVASNKKVWWICSKGHEWQTTVSDRSSGHGCPYCSGHRAWAGFNDLATIRPDLAAQWHPTKNCDLTPDKVTVASNKKAWWICNKGHEWQAAINSRSSGNGCPVCNSEKQTSFPEQAILYYLSRVTTAVSRYRIDEKREVDIFLSELNTAIEYDGWYWHKQSGSLKREENKNEYLAKTGIRLIRVRDIGEDEQTPHDTKDVIYCRYTQNGEYLSDVICKIVERLGITGDIDVNPARDSLDIYNQYIKLEKEDSLAIKLPDLAKEWHPTKNGKLTPERIPFSSNKKVWWVCNKGHEWQESPNARSAGNGCPYCSGHRAWPGFNDLATVRPELAAQWHPEKNGDLKPTDVTSASNKEVWWLCEQGHEWQAKINDRNRGNGCPYCSGRKVISGVNDLATLRPDLASQWHPRRNGDLTPADVKVASNKKVWWMCDKGHEWQASVDKRNYGGGCPICLGRKVLAGFNDLATINPELAAQWHPTKNGDLTPRDVTTMSNKKVWWMCDKGHEWQAKVSDRGKGRGCAICSGRKVLAGFNDLATVNPELAVQWHPTKNGDLTPKDVTAGSGKKVWWMCDKGHEWQAVIGSRNSGCGCPICSKVNHKKRHS